MLRAPLQRLYERLGPRYPRVVLAFVFLLSCFVVGGGVLLLNLYVDISLSTFWRIFAVSAVLVAIEVGAALWLAYRLVRPADRWLRGERTPDTALAACSRGCRWTSCASGAASRSCSTRSRSRSTSRSSSTAPS